MWDPGIEDLEYNCSWSCYSNIKRCRWSSHKISVNNTDLSIYQPIKRIYLITSDNTFLSRHLKGYNVELVPTFLILRYGIPPNLRPQFIIYIYMGLEDSLTVSQLDRWTPLSTHTFIYCQTTINKLDIVYGSFWVRRCRISCLCW